ncbi:hypothetical protein AALO_G00165260 [Alosa alosa]|uniref:poly(ADP-ribose) glycohydrolase n=2 Tax=Alosa alosa TaxID=278164 RepID=A0AAV6GBT3_9TELE|nr:hypothetical protein AALO_G00165260 [Alosa alosa]
MQARENRVISDHMARKNDSSGVGSCINGSYSGGSEKDAQGSDQHRSRTAHDPEKNLIDFSTVGPSAAGTSGSGSRRGSAAAAAGAKDGFSGGREDNKWQQGSSAASGITGQTPKPSSASGSDDRGRSDEGTSGGREDNKWHGTSGAASLSTREAPRWNTRTVKDCNVKLASLFYSADHIILIDVNEFRNTKKLKAMHGTPLWDALHVKMPHANENIFKTKSTFLGNIETQSRWSAISKQLKKLRTGSMTVADIEKVIKSYNPQYSSWSFEGLQKYVEKIPREEKEIFFKVIPKMAELALKLTENVQRGLPLLKQGRSYSITLSQIQIATLLANAFFCTFPHRNTTAKNAEYSNYPTINFSSLFGNFSQTTMEKLRAIVHYFNTVTCQSSRPQGLVTFERCFIPDHQLPRWRQRNEHLGNVRVTSEGTIEKEGRGMLQVDFACSMVGGGVLGSGLVQEEILFLMNPELIVARLFTEKLSDNECLKITGAQQYSEYTGYSSSFEWSGPHNENLERDNWMRLHRQIVAIDALNFKHPKEQYQMKKIKRELNKAFVGFREEGHFAQLPTVATGNWGCGAFHGDPILKALIQMMGAAVAERDMVFFTFGDTHLERRLRNMHTLLKERKSTVGDLYTMLDFYCQSSRPQEDLYQFIQTYMNNKSSL